MSEESEYKEGPCRWCGAPGAVFADNGLCEGCDSNVVNCSICNEEQHANSHCRHVFQDADLQWVGSGAWANDHVRDAFFRLLDLMPRGFDGELFRAINEGKFHTWFVAPMIGDGAIITLYGMNGGDVRYGDVLAEIGGGDQARETADGYHWMASLYDAATPGANETTLAWLSDWQARAELPRWADDGGRV